MSWSGWCGPPSNDIRAYFHQWYQKVSPSIITPSKGKKTKGGDKFFHSTSIFPSRKIPQGLTPDPPKPKEYEEDAYNDEDEKMELEEKKGEDSEKKKENITILLGKPQEKEGQGGFFVGRDKRSHS